MTMHSRSTTSAPASAAFTLFEIAIALGLVSFAVVTVMLSFPAGLKAQQFARFRVIAATKAEEMVEAFNATANANPAIDTEAMKPWDVPVSYRSQAFDLEQRLSSHRFGIMPVPTDIARRLDSNGDEIQRLLDDGAYLYYSQPMATTNTEERNLVNANQTDTEAPNESQRLVFAILGYPQNNAVHILAKKNWPYYVPYPSPPTHSFLYNEFLPAGLNMTRFQWDYAYDRPVPQNESSNISWMLQSACVEEAWEHAHDPQGGDPDIRKVFFWQEGSDYYGFLPFMYGRYTGPADSATPYYWSTLPNQGVPSRGSLMRYVQAAYWYCVQKGIDPGTYDPGSPSTIPAGFDASPEPWKQVQAMRFLAHATACMTSFYPHSSGDSTIVGDPYLSDAGPGVPIPPVTLGGQAGPPNPIGLTDGKIRYYHERSLRMIMQFSAENPYDWRVPRPTQRAIMMDHPLLEYDLFSPPDSGKISGSNEDAAQWKPIPAQPVLHPGASWMYPAHQIDPSTSTSEWGQSSHFTLTAPFKPMDRCRQIVFWAADWHSYTDFETAPSAPVDASKYPFAAPHALTYSNWVAPAGSGAVYQFKDALGSATNPMCGLEWADDHLFSFRNPEKVLMFKESMSGKPSGHDVSSIIVMNDNAADRGLAGDAPDVFSGRFGADRNFNLRLDHGPLPTSARLRAIEVARFNYYDPRVPLTIR